MEIEFHQIIFLNPLIWCSPLFWYYVELHSCIKPTCLRCIILSLLYIAGFILLIVCPGFLHPCSWQGVPIILLLVMSSTWLTQSHKMNWEVPLLLFSGRSYVRWVFIHVFCFLNIRLFSFSTLTISQHISASSIFIKKLSVNSIVTLFFFFFFYNSLSFFPPLAARKISTYLWCTAVYCDGSRYSFLCIYPVWGSPI